MGVCHVIKKELYHVEVLRPDGGMVYECHLRFGVSLPFAVGTAGRLHIRSMAPGQDVIPPYRIIVTVEEQSSG